MIRYPAQLVNRARNLASKGLTYREIGTLLNVDNSNVSVWCRDSLENNPRKLVQKIRDKRDKVKKSDTGFLDKIDFNKSTKRLICAIIYGCEGSKYPASNCVALANSEPGLVASFMGLFRECYKIDETKLRVHMQIHSNQDYAYLVRFWSNLLKIPSNKFLKPVITRAGGNKHRNNYMGTCTVKYYDYRLQLKLIGIYERFMRKFALLEGIPNGSGNGSLNHIA